MKKVSENVWVFQTWWSKNKVILLTKTLTLRGVGLQLPTQMRGDVAASTLRSLRLQVQTSNLEQCKTYLLVLVIYNLYWLTLKASESRLSSLFPMTFARVFIHQYPDDKASLLRLEWVKLMHSKVGILFKTKLGLKLLELPIPFLYIWIMFYLFWSCRGAMLKTYLLSNYKSLVVTISIAIQSGKVKCIPLININIWNNMQALNTTYR